MAGSHGLHEKKMNVYKHFHIDYNFPCKWNIRLTLFGFTKKKLQFLPIFGSLSFRLYYTQVLVSELHRELLNAVTRSPYNQVHLWGDSLKTSSPIIVCRRSIQFCITMALSMYTYTDNVSMFILKTFHMS